MINASLLIAHFNFMQITFIALHMHTAKFSNFLIK